MEELKNITERIEISVYPKRNENFRGCDRCIHAGDTEEICHLRMCVHSFHALRECYEERPEAAGEEKKIIKNASEELKSITCHECGSVFEYTEADVTERTIHFFTGNIDENITKRCLTCPVCESEFIIPDARLKDDEKNDDD